MDQSQYYRNLENIAQFPGDIRMSDLDPAPLLQQIHHQRQMQDRLDLNLHPAPDPTAALSLLRPLGSDLLEMPPQHSPYSLWSESITSSGPPSPGELDFGIFQHQLGGSPWGMDFSDRAATGHLDLDLSPLLQEQEDDDVEHEQQQEPEAKERVFASSSSSQQQQQQNDCEKRPQQLQDQDKQLQQQQDSSAFFECNVCLDAANDPVVTACGHLFCWACLYQWLHLHSTHAECPVCKGAVTDDDIIPIYGRGGGKTATSPSPQLGDMIPPRPRARRADSFRQRQGTGALLPAAPLPEGAMLNEMLRWRRAVRVMQENVDRLFAARGGGSGGGVPPPPRRRRLPERRGGLIAPGRSEEALLAAIRERSGGGGGEGMVEQLQQRTWQAAVGGAARHLLPPMAYRDLTSSATADVPLFTPPLGPYHDNYAYQFLRRV